MQEVKKLVNTEERNSIIYKTYIYQGWEPSLNDFEYLEDLEAIQKRLNFGDLWAWCVVTIEATHSKINNISKSNCLGGCSFKDFEDFKNSGYYEDMLIQSKDDLINNLKDLKEKLNKMEAL